MTVAREKLIIVGSSSVLSDEDRGPLEGNPRVAKFREKYMSYEAVDHGRF
jgi:hypothetical protein